MKEKYLFYFSIPIAIVTLLDVFGINLDSGSGESENILVVVWIFFTLISAFALWYYMLVDSYKKSKKQFFFLLLFAPYMWIYYLVFYRQEK